MLNFPYQKILSGYPIGYQRRDEEENQGIMSDNPGAISLDTAYQQYIERVHNLFWRE